MTRAAFGSGGGLPAWLEAEGVVAADVQALGDADRIRQLLIAAARENRAVSYSELLNALGHRFTRPRMRAICRTLDAIDRASAAADEPALAVLVVRESDRLPGQGWWIGRDGPSSDSAEAHAYVRDLQETAFRYWRAAAAEDA